MIKKYGAQILFILLLLINIFWAGYLLNQKQGWHVDEIFSYGHANSSLNAYLSQDIDSYFQDKKTDLHNRWLDGKLFHDYLTVQENERFSYGHIKDNLRVVEHPLLFYFLLHTVCSFSPDKMSPWQAGSINLFFFMLTLLVFYKLSKLFIKDDYLAMVPVFLWGFSAVGLSTVLFLRMYMLQTFFAVLLLYEVSKMLIENEANKKQLFLIFLWATLGNLTQFSSLIFAFFVAVVAGVVLLYRKNFKVLILFSLVMLLSVVALFAVYPQAYGVLFHSMRGTESADKINGFLSNISSLWLAILYSNTPSRIFGIYFEGLFGLSNVSDGVLLLLAIGAFFLIYRLKVKLNGAFLPMLLIIVLMTLYLYLMMPNMGVFQMRYYMMLMPVAALVLVYAVILILRNFRVNKLCCGLLAVLVVISVLWKNNFKHDVFFVPLTEETLQATDILKNKKIIVKSRVCAVFDIFGVLAHADKVYWAREDDDLTQVLDEADFVLYYNSYATLYTPIGSTKACFFCIPKARRLLENEKGRLKYALPFRNGVVNFDLYEVIKK